MQYPPEFHYNRFAQVTERIERQGNLITDLREKQVIFTMEQKGKLNWLAFAFVGGALAFNPNALQSLWTALGAMGLLLDALILGYIADVSQGNLNIKGLTDQLDNMKNGYQPYANAYDDFTRDPSVKNEQALIDSYLKYLDDHNGKEAPLTKKTKLSRPKIYFGMYLICFLAFCYGVYKTSLYPTPAEHIIEGEVKLINPSSI